MDMPMTDEIYEELMAEPERGSRRKKQGKEQRYTTDYIENLPEGTRVELINGRIYDMAAPSWTHQGIAGELFAVIRDYIRKKGGTCKVRFSPIGVYLNNDKRTYVEPDIVVVCDPSKIDDKGCHGAPDWVIEVVSPSSVQMDYMIKTSKYGDAGVREYWAVDPERKNLIIYKFLKDAEDGADKFEYDIYTFDDTVPVGIYPDFEIDFKEIMASL